MAHDGHVTIPEKRETPAAELTAWQKLEAIGARVTAEWDNPSLIASGLIVPNLRDNILRILNVPTVGEGAPIGAPVEPPGEPPVVGEPDAPTIEDFPGIPDEPSEFAQYLGRPLSGAGLSPRLEKLLIAGYCDSLFYLMQMTREDLIAIKGIGPVFAAQIEARQAVVRAG